MRITFDRLVNGVVLAVCVIIGAHASLQLLDRLRPGIGPTPASNSVAPQQTYQVGEVVPALNDYSYSNAEATLVLVVRSTCGFCTQSMPFYDRLIDAVKRTDGLVRVVAVSNESVDVLQQYFDSHGVALESFRTIPNGYLRVAGTPTVLLIDGRGVVQDVWIGLLAPDGETAVLETIKRAGSGV